MAEVWHDDLHSGMNLQFLLRQLLVLVAATTCSLAAPMPDSAGAVKALFKDPPRKFSTGPLWVWNDMLTDEQIRGTLQDLADQKIKQVWVHPRPGLMTPYLSPEWFRLWKLALKEAERLDMNVWIYDENSYPSGFAGGWVPEVMPESRGRGLNLREVKTVPAWSSNIVAAYRLDGDRFENVSAKARAGESLPEGNYLIASELRAGNSPWHGDRCYVNLLSPGVTEKFLELTLEPYRREIGSEFGKRVPGVFTDEPNIRPAGGFPWSETLAAEFQKRWGYDLIENLPSLARPVGDWRRVRHNYFQVLHEQFVEHWARPYHDYCEKHGLQFTGHYWDHEWPNCMGVPDNMAMYAWHQLPAIDCLMNQYAEHTHAQFGNVRMVKELSSVANQLGIRQTLCEIYGAGGWDLRFEDMKRIGDWLEVLGVNVQNQHLSYVTLRGARKRDHPQSFSYHEPWWQDYHISAEYLARISMVLAHGQQVNRVLVLEPTTTAWMYQPDAAKLKDLGDAFFELLMSLEAAQVEYDIGCEDILKSYGSIETNPAPRRVSSQPSARISIAPKGSELRVGQRCYATIIIPPGTENLNLRTVELLERLLAENEGTEVFCLGTPPSKLDGNPSPRLQALAGRPRWRKLAPQEVLANSLCRGAPDTCTVTRDRNDKGKLFHNRRELSDGQILFLVNTSAEAASGGFIEWQGEALEEWDLYTGGIAPYPREKTVDGARARFDLAPSGSLLLFLPRKGSASASAKTTPVEWVTIKPVSGPDAQRVKPNVLVLDWVDITAKDLTRTNVYFYEANQFAWKQNGVERNPWDSAVQFKDELISRTFPRTSGFEASYHFQVAGSVPPDLCIVIERPDLYRIFCNGKQVIPTPGDWWLDKAFLRIPLAFAARTGANTVTVKASPFTVYHELEPAYVLGSFSLHPTDQGFLITAEKPIERPGSAPSGHERGWNSQGLPFYGDAVNYTEYFDVEFSRQKTCVSLGAWRGSVARVKVNGRDAGCIDAPPWECDVTRFLDKGRNKIEVSVVGTLKNTLGPHHGKPGLGSAWPGSFQRGPARNPAPGLEYSTVAYGLFEPFVLKRQR
jgi:hypothetical protein